jgi:DNA-directed RNA polymerase I subunit RPA43
VIIENCSTLGPRHVLLVTMTGILPDPQSKKRKHRPTEDPDTTHSVSRKKKEKRHKATAQSVAPPSEDALSSQKRKPKSVKDKGKSRALDLPSEFHVINASLVLSIPPVFASDLRAGVEEMLDSMIMR